jgi:hypothetical protein
VTLQSLVAIAATVFFSSAVFAQDNRSALPITRLSDRPYAYTTYSGVADSLDLVVRDSASLDSTWREINRPFIPAPRPPAVDFQREMLLVTALGRRSTGGYDIVFENAIADSSGIEVAVRVESPATGCPLNAAVTQPVDLARIPATARPVRFRRRNVVVPCGVR